jgi:DNA-directed RNA polymerase subunit RPC12/RpoP
MTVAYRRLEHVPGGGAAATLPKVDHLKCTQCGATGLEPGFIEDSGEGSRGYARWIAGPLERGLLGGAKRKGRARWQIDAHRCPQCSHLELFANRPT